MRTGARLCLVGALVVAAHPAAAQAPPTPPVPTVASCGESRIGGAVAQTLGINLVINRANAWLFGFEFGEVGLESWARNLRRGFRWDGTQFGVNLFLHPYHGSLYMTAARANCLTFWESIPIVFLGAWTWEFLGETHRAALNDFYTTGFGGLVLGEIMHRMAAAVIDEEAEGAERIGREVLGLFANPIGGLNRLVRGQWTRRGVNPPDRIPEAYHFAVKGGARRVQETEPGKPPAFAPTLLADLTMGDVFETEYRAPFDVLDAQAQVSPDGGGGGLNLLRASGRLYGNELTSPDSWHRHQLVINQRLDYTNNPVYNFGEQSLELGVRSRWRADPRGFRFNTRLTADVVILGAVEALDSGLGQRTVDWGPGVGAVVALDVEYNGTTYLSFYNRVRRLWAVTGEPANHTLLFSGLDFTIPVTSRLGVGAYVSGDRRKSDYANFPDTRRSYVETRIYLSWTLAHRASQSAR